MNTEDLEVKHSAEHEEIKNKKAFETLLHCTLQSQIAFSGRPYRRYLRYSSTVLLTKNDKPVLKELK